MTADTVHVTARYAGQSEEFEFSLDQSISDLQSHVASLYDLDQSTVKLIGLSKGRLVDQSIKLSELSIKANQLKLSVLGSKRSVVQSIMQKDQEMSEQLKREQEREAQMRADRELREAIETSRREEQARLYEEQMRVRQIERQEQMRLREVERQRQRELYEQSLNEPQSISITLNAVHSPDCDNQSINQPGLILPSDLLQRLVDSRVPFPLTFKVTVDQSTTQSTSQLASDSHIDLSDDDSMSNQSISQSPEPTPSSLQAFSQSMNQSPDSSKQSSNQSTSRRADAVYYTVLSFESPNSSIACAPRALFDRLMIADGSKVQLTTVELPKATHVTLRPINNQSDNQSINQPTLTPSQRSKFLKLSEPERRALLELTLKRRTILSVGDVIHVKYRDDVIDLLIDELLPNDACSIVDADVSADVIESYTVNEQDHKSQNDNHHMFGVDVSNLMLDDVIEGSLDQLTDDHFSINIPDEHSAYQLNLSCSAGDADLYVCYSSVVNDATSLPNPMWYDERSVNEGDDSVILSHQSLNFRPGTAYVTVHAHTKPVSYKLSFKQVNQTATSNQSIAADTQQCPNCQRHIPIRAMSLHSAQCARLNVKCSTCSAVMPKAQLAKHIEMTHQLVKCPNAGCEWQYSLPELNQHRHETCTGRLVECSYCPMLSRARDRGEHQAECGLLRSSCHECHEHIQRKLIRRHMKQQHGRDEKEITWKDFF